MLSREKPNRSVSLKGSSSKVSSRKARRAAVENESPNVTNPSLVISSSDSPMSMSGDSFTEMVPPAIEHIHIDHTEPLTDVMRACLHLMQAQYFTGYIFYSNQSHFLTEHSNVVGGQSRIKQITVSAPFLVVDPQQFNTEPYLPILAANMGGDYCLPANIPYEILLVFPNNTQLTQLFLTKNIYVLDVIKHQWHSLLSELCKQQSKQEVLYPFQLYIVMVNGESLFVTPRQKIHIVDYNNSYIPGEYKKNLIEKLDPSHLNLDRLEADHPYSLIDVDEYIVFKQPIRILKPHTITSKESCLFFQLSNFAAQVDFDKFSVFSLQDSEKEYAYYMLSTRMVARPRKAGGVKFAFEMIPPGSPLQATVSDTFLGKGGYGAVRLFGGHVRRNQADIYEFSSKAKVDKEFFASTREGETEFFSYNNSETEYQYTDVLAQDYLNPSRPIHDFSHKKSSHLFLNYLPGKTLADALDEDFEGVCILKLNDYFVILETLLKSFDKIFKKGLLHGDIKPENCMFMRCDDYSSIRPTDFGLTSPVAKEMFEPGTVDYAAPELLNAKAPRSIKTELFSFGTMAFEMFGVEEECLTYKQGEDGGYTVIRPTSMDDVPVFTWWPDDDKSDKCYLHLQHKQALFDLISRINSTNPADRPNNWKEVLAEIVRIRTERAEEMRQFAESNEQVAASATRLTPR